MASGDQISIGSAVLRSSIQGLGSTFDQGTDEAKRSSLILEYGLFTSNRLSNVVYSFDSRLVTSSKRRRSYRTNSNAANPFSSGRASAFFRAPASARSNHVAWCVRFAAGFAFASRLVPLVRGIFWGVVWGSRLALLLAGARFAARRG